MKRVLILGAGTAGTMMANKLVNVLPDGEWRVTVLDRDDAHVYQPGLLLLPFGVYREDELVRPRRRLLDRRVELKLAEVDRVVAGENRVHLQGGEAIAYDVLVVATGSRVMPEQTPGLTGAGWRETAHEFYTLSGAVALREALSRFSGGRVVVNIVEMPIKCPVAPLEMAFLLEAHFTQQGIRDKVDITYATPLEGAFTKPRASAALGGMLASRGIRVVGDFSLAEVSGEQRVMKAYDGRELGYDLLVTVPLHGGSELIARSGLGDAGGWVPTDKHTLQSPAYPNVFALGDATDLPSSKAGAVAHFQGEVLVENVVRFTQGRPLSPGFDGHANCFIETGHGKAMLIDFNYQTEPLPGRFPLPGIGPFSLLEESEANHWGKLAFKWIYWNVLLAGKELPLDHRMLLAGKWSLAEMTTQPRPPAAPPHPSPAHAPAPQGAPHPHQDSIAQRLDALAEQVSYLVERQKKQEELIAEMSPIARLAMGSATERLDALEKKGYFAFGKEMLRVGERVVENYSAEDVRALGDAVLAIVDTVRALTQPEVLRVAGEATVALAAADEAQPLGLVGMVRASRDEDVQKGMAVLMELLRHVGRGARAAADQRARSPERARRDRLSEMTASRKKPLGVERPKASAQAPSRPPAPAPAPAPRSVEVDLAELGPPTGCAVPTKGPQPVATVIDGVGFTADGHLADPSAWSRDLALAIASAQGVTMGEPHWRLVELARADFEKNGVSPNIRRLTQASGLSTKDIYALFPRAPARTVAKVAGIPKPAGCL